MLAEKTPKILDAEHLLESANNSARHFRTAYFAYLTVMIYIFIIVLSTDQELLFRAGDKPLPLVHISVPIVAFFTWMPWTLLVLHFYLLIQVRFLSNKVHFYRQEINNYLKSRNIRKAKMLLAPIPLVHILVEGKAGFKQHKMLYLIVFVSLVVFPLIVLIVAQMKFLPYQDEIITWSHRAVILIDVLVLSHFWRDIFGSHKGKMIWIRSIVGLLVILLVVFVFIFIDFPSNKIYNHFTASFYKLEATNKIMPNRFVLLNRKLVEREPAPELLAVHLEGQTDNANLIGQSSSTWCQYADSLDLKNRNFRKAQLKRTALCKVTLQDADLTDADLSDANLMGANLEDADLTSANLQGANLTSADIRGANLTSAILFDADITSASLLAANLTSAYLNSANLTSANLNSVNLINADLRGANFTGADLRGASLTSANLQGANLTHTNLGAANFIDANLLSASLISANLQVVDLTSANLSSTNFSDAILEGATLDFTWFWESFDLEERAYFPIGIPRGGDDILKPEYLCPWSFHPSSYYDIPEYINEDGEVEQEKLKERLKQIIEKNCKRYELKSTR